MTFEDHCKESIQVLGQAYEHVHLWLDEYAGQAPYGSRHRHKRHHLQGIEEVRKQWGDDAATAARLHIISDLKGEGWKDTDPFPKDEGHYKRMGLW